MNKTWNIKIYIVTIKKTSYSKYLTLFFSRLYSSFFCIQIKRINIHFFLKKICSSIFFKKNMQHIRRCNSEGYGFFDKIKCWNYRFQRIISVNLNKDKKLNVKIKIKYGLLYLEIFSLAFSAVFIIGVYTSWAKHV